MQSVRTLPISHIIEYDASLEGLGVGVGQIVGNEKTMLCIGETTFPFDLNHDSSYQNTMVFLAVVTGMAALVRRVVKGATIKL